MAPHPRPLVALTRFVDRLSDPLAESPLVWRSLAMLYVAAATIVAMMLLSGFDVGSATPVLAALTVATLAVGLLLVRIARRVPPSWMAVGLVLGLAFVSAAVIVAGRSDTPLALFYIWISVEAWFFLRRRDAVAITALTILTSAAVMLLVVPGTDAVAWWVAVAGSLAALSALAGILHGRAVRLIARLEDAVVRDPLTGLLNRRGYQERLRAELDRAARYGMPLSIVLGDLDSFKVLNDRHGHRHGDEALRTFARICEQQLRRIDFVSRVGGEEFAIVLPHTDAQDAVVTAERLRRAVAAELQGPDGSAVTASFGVAAFPEHGLDAEILLDHADQAMYAAKARGRDRTILFEDGLEAERAPAGREEHLQAVLMLAETLDLRDPATHAHSETVAGLCEELARGIGLAEERVARVRLAGMLHDIGKIGVPDSILRKPGPLDSWEWGEMRKHPELGARIVESAGLHDVGRWVLAHHERPDGSGYPYGLEDAQIPVEAKILAIADSFEAMTADRPYRSGMPVEAALDELRRCAGSQFDGEVVECFAAARAARIAA